MIDSTRANCSRLIAGKSAQSYRHADPRLTPSLSPTLTHSFTLRPQINACLEPAVDCITTFRVIGASVASQNVQHRPKFDFGQSGDQRRMDGAKFYVALDTKYVIWRR